MLGRVDGSFFWGGAEGLVDLSGGDGFFKVFKVFKVFLDLAGFVFFSWG